MPTSTEDVPVHTPQRKYIHSSHFGTVFFLLFFSYTQKITKISKKHHWIGLWRPETRARTRRRSPPQNNYLVFLLKRLDQTEAATCLERPYGSCDTFWFTQSTLLLISVMYYRVLITFNEAVPADLLVKGRHWSKICLALGWFTVVTRKLSPGAN